MKAFLVVVALVAYANAAFQYTVTNGRLTISGGDIPDYTSVTQVPWYAQRGDIKSILINSGVEKIGDYAFSGLSEVTSVNLGSVKKIKDFSFSGCSKITNILLPSTTKEIGKHAFEGCTSLSSIDLYSSKIEKIDDYAFSLCSSLKSISFPGVEKVKEHCFDGCSSLKTVEIESGVEEIQTGAFKACTSLKEITIPETVKTVYDGAFEGCVNLTQVTYRGVLVNPVYGTSDPFKSCPSLEFVCVSRDYPFDKFGQRTVYPRATSPELAPVIAEENHCYGAYICNSTYGFIMERVNKSKWESQAPNECGSFYCNNETGGAMHSICNSTDVCYSSSNAYRSYDIDCDSNDDMKFRGWTVAISFVNVSAARYNNVTMRSAIKNMTKVTSEYLGSEISADGNLLNIYYIVRGNTSAFTVEDVLKNTLGKSNCTYGLVCEGKEVSIIEGPIYDAAHHVYESVFVLLLAIIISFVNF